MASAVRLRSVMFGESDDSARDAIVRRPVGKHAAQIPFVGAAAHFGFDHGQLVQNRLDIAKQVLVSDFSGEVTYRTADVGLREIEEFRRGGREPFDAQAEPSWSAACLKVRS